MKIEIKADKDAILGGPEHVAYLKLELRSDGHAVLKASHRPIGRVPQDDWCGCIRAWTASLSPASYAIADLAALETLAERLRSLLARVIAGHSAWDGSNQDAREAYAEIEELLHAAEWWDEKRQVWEADDWLFELGYHGAARDYGLDACSSDAAFKVAGKKMEADALTYGVVLVDVETVLWRIKDVLRADIKEDA